jgi:hypothetical protein
MRLTSTLALLSLVAIATPRELDAQALLELDGTCTVSVLNRSVRVGSDGTWVLPNVPAGFGLVRVRATCTRGGNSLTGESSLVDVPLNGVIDLTPILLAGVTPVPRQVQITLPKTKLTSISESVQANVIASYDGAPDKNITAGMLGTTYNVSNPLIASVSSDGLVTARSPGAVVLQVIHEGASALIRIEVSTTGDADGDGIADDVEQSLGLSPNDPSDAKDDLDRDGLSNFDEIARGTNIRNPDTDGDGLKDGEEVLRGTNPLLADTDGDLVPDGLEIQAGTNPLDARSVNLSGAIDRLEVSPPAPVLVVNSLSPEASVQLRVNAVLKDGSRLDLVSSARGTRYSSSDLNICNFGATPGQVFAGQPGICTVTVTNGTFSSQVPIRVESFNPVNRSTLNVPGAVAIEISGSNAFVVGGTQFRTLDISDRSSPREVKTLDISGVNMTDVRVSGNYAYAAGSDAGLVVIDIANRANPRVVATIDTPGNAQDIAIAGGARLYLADGANGLLTFDLANPANPVLASTLILSAPVLGVAVDASRNLAVAALGTGGIQLINVSSATQPSIRGALSGGNVRDVGLKGAVALLADQARSVTSVDISNPDLPVLGTSTRSDLGGVPLDLAYSGDFLSTADFSFGAVYPIISVAEPLLPAPRFFLNAVPRGFGTGIAIDASFTYLITANNLQISQYRSLTDNNGVPPQVSISTPVPGSSVIGRSVVPISIQAADDVQVATVQLLVGDQVVGTTFAAPYIIGLPVPKGIESITVRARAIDLGGNIGESTAITYNVIVGPLTTVIGTGADRQGNPIANARVNVINEFYGQSVAGGAYSISGVPAALSRVRAYGEVAINGVVLRGRSAFASTIGNGTTNVGPMVYFPDADWDGLPDEYELANSCLAVNSADDESDPDGDGLTTFRELELGTNPCLGNLLPGQTTVLSFLISLRNGPPPSAVLPNGFNEVSSALVSLRNGAPPDATLPEGRNEVLSALIAVSNGVVVANEIRETMSGLISLRNGPAPTAVLPSGFNEISSSLISLRNGLPPSAVLPAGSNETSSSLVSLRNGTASLPVGQSETFSFPLTLNNSNSNAPPMVSEPSASDAVSAGAGKNPSRGGGPGAAQQVFVVTGETFLVRYDAKDSRVVAVEFLLDGASLGEVRAEPFEAAFVIPSGVSSIQVRAVAKGSDGEGLASSDQILSVLSEEARPVVLRVMDLQNRPVLNQDVEIVRPGLLAEVFDSDSPLREMPALGDRVANLVTEVSSVGFRNPDGIFGLDPFGTTFYPDFAIRLSGRIAIASGGEYQFSLRSHEGARLSIGGKEVVTVPGGLSGSASRQAAVKLEAAFHEIVVEYYEALGPPELNLEFARNGGPLRAVPQNMLSHVHSGRTDSVGQLDLKALPTWMKDIQVSQKGGAMSIVRSPLNGATVVLKLREDK